MMDDSFSPDQLQPDQLQTVQRLLQQTDYGKKALTALETQGDFAAAFEQLWVEQHGPSPTMGDRPSLWQLTLKRLRQEICGDEDSFRSKLKEYKKSVTSAPLLTGLVMSLVNMAGLPIDPTIATVIVLYILHIGLDVFCEYTAPAPDSLPPSHSPPVLPPSDRSDRSDRDSD